MLCGTRDDLIVGSQWFHKRIKGRNSYNITPNIYNISHVGYHVVNYGYERGEDSRTMEEFLSTKIPYHNLDHLSILLKVALTFARNDSSIMDNFDEKLIGLNI